jgi:hypothetical protein
MTDNDVISVEGFDELLKALEQSPETILPLLEKAMQKSVRAIQERVAEYPPSTEANQPGRISLKNHKPMGYYERGRGWWYPIMRPWSSDGQRFGKALGVIKSSAVVRKGSAVQGYRLAGGGESEQLGKSWTVNVRSGDGGVLGEVGTNTSYAPWVQGDRQWNVHGKRGWKTVDRATEESMEDITGFFSEALDEWNKTLVP